jgi:RNA polymerase-interacting CarD/CdnL/TRCF family regulator
MMESSTPYSVGDWVVHSYYGVGQIENLESKPINGETTRCYKVKTNNSTFWFPASDEDNPRVRPVASKEVISKMIKNLRRKSSKLDTDRKIWKNRIDEVQADGDLLSISIFIRDLSAQQVLRQLNQTEEDALEYFKERLLLEWASITDDDVEDLRIELNGYIKESQAKVPVE